MKKIRLNFAGVRVEYANREQALGKIEDLAKRGTALPWTVYGPEGCGKTAWLKQSAMLLKELDFDVVYLNPLEKEFVTEVGVEDVKKKLVKIFYKAVDEAWAKAAWAIIDIARELIRAGRGRLAVLVDDVFSTIGLDKAAIYVKGLLGLIEYPPRSYDAVIAVVATNEGVSRREIGRHRWASHRPMWNMPREGFRQLYDQLPGRKPEFEDVWKNNGR